MKYLENIGFSKDEIAELEDVTPDKLLDTLKMQKRLVMENINYLKELGIPNYKEVFLQYYDMFLMDNSNFKEVFDKYEKDDLIEKISQNISIVEYL